MVAICGVTTVVNLRAILKENSRLFCYGDLDGKSTGLLVNYGTGLVGVKKRNMMTFSGECREAYAWSWI